MKNRLLNLDFFRILFTLTIVYGHCIQHFMMPNFGSLPVFANLKVSYAFGYMCDMFFILSGFFMYYSIEKCQNFKEFIVNKIARLWSVLFFSLFVQFILSIFKVTSFNKYGNFLGLFFLDDAFSTTIETNNGAAWYINVMFWCYIFYYCLKNIIPENKVVYSLSLICIVCYSFLFSKGHLYEQPQSFGPLTVPMMRGLAGMGLGWMIALYYQKKCSLNIEKKNSLLFSVLEIILMAFLVKIAIIKTISISFQFLIVVFIILFYLFLFQKGFFSRILNKPIISCVAKYMFSIYMMQECVFAILNKFVFYNKKFGVEVFPILNVFICILLCVIVGIIVYYFIEKPGVKILKGLLNEKNIDNRS